MVEEQFPEEDFVIVPPVNYQPRQPPILNDHEKNIVLTLPNDMKDRIFSALMFMNGDTPIDLLPAFAAYKLKLIPSKCKLCVLLK